MTPFSLNIKGEIREYAHPLVMGILNATDDSYYGDSASLDSGKLTDRAAMLAAEGADIIDIGGMSTRPGYKMITEAEERRRLALGITAARAAAPDTPISIDTFRAGVARWAVEEMGADIINDITGGADADMLPAVAELHVPYVLMNSRGPAGNLHRDRVEHDFMPTVLREIAEKVERARLAGVCDIILDPGFGFGMSLGQNWELLRHLDTLQVFKLPVLVGISRKSMITKLLGIKTEDALCGTVAVNTIALAKGASILRVHDVKAARETVEISMAEKGTGTQYDNE